MLELLLDKGIGKDEKLDRLEAEYAMQKTVELEGKVTKMSDYSMSIYLDGVAEGEKKAYKKAYKRDKTYW